MPHSARIWNCWLGGKDNYAVDREAGDQYAGDQYKEIFPGIAVAAQTSRAFLRSRSTPTAGSDESRNTLSSEDPRPLGLLYGFAPGGHAELAVDRLRMGLDRVRGYIQL